MVLLHGVDGLYAPFDALRDVIGMEDAFQAIIFELGMDASNADLSKKGFSKNKVKKT